ncbi:hypothetical protein [Mesorhizobium sanjuanii]|uniref:hypothetical protein n=1 Tax=Mesorhizobium sanjuanii TaxID=2037900 RepID=UPI001FDFACC5|nr:hypothetical protein [Mesorhizobium sanjuanii]
MKSGIVRSSSCAISRREGRVSEQNADTAARNSLSAFPDSVRITICLKSEDDTEDTPDTRHDLAMLNRDCVGFAFDKNKDQVSDDPLAFR